VADVIDWFAVVEDHLRRLPPEARVQWVADHQRFCEMRRALLLREEPVPEGWPNHQQCAQ
jgi:hypothetical protein